MIKIIKEGKKEFTRTCFVCGCEFSYELDDLKKGAAYAAVNCPCYGDEIIHSDVGKEYTQDFLTSPRSNIKSVTSNPTIKDNMVYETAIQREFQKALEESVKQPSYVECNY